MIIQDLRPIRIVECEGFRSLLSYSEPGYTLSSRKNFVSDINHKFKMCKGKLRTRLEQEALCVLIFGPLWLLRHTRQPLCIMLTTTGICKILCLKLERHTRVNIAEKLKEITERWGIFSMY